MDAEALSILDWWATAGVGALADDSPRDWLGPPAKPQAHRRPTAALSAPLLPADLAALDAYVGDPANLATLGPARIRAEGDPATELAILVDMAEPGEARLFEGPQARLFDRMLAALGRDRASVYLVPLCPARPAGGIVPEPLRADLACLARHRLALARPSQLILFGQASAAAFGLSITSARPALQKINHGAGEVPAVAIHHPRMLMRQPARKADAWAAMCLLLGGDRS